MGVDLKQNDKGVFSARNDLDQVDDMQVGGPATPSVSSPRIYSDGMYKMPLAAGVDTGGGIVAWSNPFNYSTIVQGCILDVTTASTGTCTLIGGTAANATASSTNVLTATSVAATATSNSGFKSVKWTTGQFFTVSTSTGTSTGLVGNLYVILSPA